MHLILVGLCCVVFGQCIYMKQVKPAFYVSLDMYKPASANYNRDVISLKH